MLSRSETARNNAKKEEVFPDDDDDDDDPVPSTPYSLDTFWLGFTSKKSEICHFCRINAKKNITFIITEEDKYSH